MAISSDEFKKGYTETTLKGAIEKLLGDCKARTQTEIQMALNANLSFTKPRDTIGWKMFDALMTGFSFGKLLDSMVSDSKIETRYVETVNRSETYYIKKSCTR
ncbi:MAG: hypothetical protein LVQ96_06685 [Thermoplasmatales archaeon]|nr:hypothetical protein [Thermoplasmatales archaeon]